ncbi:FTR1 family protein [Enterococcus camelliae]|uniref:FTR1 family protein n=1 Tax=Enterococcus camelliae TaxID=453959 RepID=A0ABW5THZ2_9ENTE
MSLIVGRRTRRAVLGRKAFIVGIFFFFSFLYAPFSHAETISVTNEEKAATVTIDRVESDDWEGANEAFQPIKQWWVHSKQPMKEVSGELAQKIDLAIAQTTIYLLNEDKKGTLEGIATLQNAFSSYQIGDYVDNEGHMKLTLSLYIHKLNQLGQHIEKSDWVQAQALIDELNTQWLSVEGDVVSRSQEIYDNTERDLLLLQNSIVKEQKEQSLSLVKSLVQELSSIDSTEYSLFDVAMIPFREGLEALLVVLMLLSVGRRSHEKKAKKWILAGSFLGVLTSILLGLFVAFVLSVLSFGKQNNLINGFAGIFSSLMLLYVGLWMHQASDVKKMTNRYHTKTKQAVETGNFFSLALLAFLAILREGLEIVVFTIGMAGKMSFEKLCLGFGLGLLFLAVIATLIILFERRLPLHVFFLFSSAIIFYLAIKFMGSGIHSLQLAGHIPNTSSDFLPSFTPLSIYPSWYSFIPQLTLVIITIGYVWINYLKKKEEKRR